MFSAHALLRESPLSELVSAHALCRSDRIFPAHIGRGGGSFSADLKEKASSGGAVKW